MKIILLLITFFIFSVNGYAQKIYQSGQLNETIYEYGKPLKSCSSNFENLFNNWSKWVTNSKHTKLISYHPVKILENHAQIIRYDTLMNSWNSLGAKSSGSHKMAGNDTSAINTRTYYFYPKTTSQARTEWEYKAGSSKVDSVRAYFKKVIMHRRTRFKNKVQIGDKVYVIKLKINGKEYDHYVVCRPGENKVVFDPLFLQIHW